MFAIGTALALCIGLSLGLLGGGGSILTVPILLYVFGLSTRVAIATSLLVVGATSVAAMLSHARAGRVRWRVGVAFGASSMVGAYLSGRLSHLVPAAVLLLLFCAMMLVTAVAMLRGRSRVSLSTQEPSSPSSRSLRSLDVVFQGLAVGAMTGLVGAGGGFVVVPALVLLGGLSMATAVGTSLLVIAMNSFAGFMGVASTVAIPWPTALCVAMASVIGSFIGTRLVDKISPEKLRRTFAYFVLAMAVFIVARELPCLLRAATVSRM